MDCLKSAYENSKKKDYFIKGRGLEGEYFYYEVEIFKEI